MDSDESHRIKPERAERITLMKEIDICSFCSKRGPIWATMDIGKKACYSCYGDLVGVAHQHTRVKASCVVEVCRKRI